MLGKHGITPNFEILQGVPQNTSHWFFGIYMTFRPHRVKKSTFLDLRGSCGGQGIFFGEKCFGYSEIIGKQMRYLQKKS